MSEYIVMQESKREIDAKDPYSTVIQVSLKGVMDAHGFRKFADCEVAQLEEVEFTPYVAAIEANRRIMSVRDQCSSIADKALKDLQAHATEVYGEAIKIASQSSFRSGLWLGVVIACAAYIVVRLAAMALA